MNWGGKESSRLRLLDCRAGPCRYEPLTNFVGRLGSEVRARARGLEVPTNGEEALAKEKCECECAGPGMHVTAENRQASLPAGIVLSSWPGSL